jgi:hypothetical protein
MSEPGKTLAATAIALPMPAAPPAPLDTARNLIGDRVLARVASRARALHLSQRLRINTIVDESGWLRANVELHYKRGRARTIQPVMVRVGQDAADSDVLADGGILGRCRKYNEAIDRLRQLGLQLAAMLRDGRIQLVPGTEVWSAHAELAQLDDTIAQRQTTRMGHGAVLLDVLATEIAFFESRGAELTPIVLAAERSASATWDGDTQDVALDSCRTEYPREKP